MAAVVVTATINRKSVFGDRRANMVTLAFDTGDYAAGGIAITPAMVGLKYIDMLQIEGAVTNVVATPTGLLGQWVPDASPSVGGKIRLFEAAAAGADFTEKPAEAMGSGATVRVLAIGS